MSAMIVKGMLWLVQVVAAAILVSFLSIWTAGYIITSYADSILKQYEIPLQIEPLAVSGVWGKLWGADQPQLSDELAVTLPESSLEVATEVEEIEEVATGGEELEDVEAGNNTPYNNEPVEEAMAPLDNSELTTEVALSPEEIIDVKDTISEEDKQVVFETLMTKLPPESWQVFSTYSEDGLTEQELIEIQQLMAQYLTDEEYENILSILKKY